MDYSEILRKMLGTAEGAKPPLDQANAALVNGTPDVAEPAYGKVIAAGGMPPDAASMGLKPAGPQVGNKPGDVVTLDNHSRTIQDTVSSMMERMNKETQREMSPELAAKYASAERKLQGPSPEELETRKTAMGEAEGQDFSSKRMRGLGLATNTLARAGGAADSSDFWKTQFKPEEASKLLAKYELADSKQRDQGRDELSMANNLKDYQALKVQGTTGKNATSSTESETEGSKQALVPAPKPTAGEQAASKLGMIPHFKRRMGPDGSPLVMNTPAQEGKLKDQVSESASLQQNGRELMALVKKHGESLLKPGPDKSGAKARYLHLSSQIRLADGFGAPQAAELKLLLSQLEDPTSAQAVLTELGGFSGVINSLETNLKMNKEKMHARMDSYGFDPDEASPWDGDIQGTGASRSPSAVPTKLADGIYKGSDGKQWRVQGGYKEPM